MTLTLLAIVRLICSYQAARLADIDASSVKLRADAGSAELFFPALGLSFYHALNSVGVNATKTTPNVATNAAILQHKDKEGSYSCA